jgi:tetratricopeptide (TPR) repeat protein
MTGRSRLVGAAAAGLLVAACGSTWWEAGRAARFYAAGQYAEAHEGFKRALERSPGPALEHNAGVALYRMKRYEEAAKRFRAAQAGSPGLRQRSLYDLGNAYVRMSEDSPDKETPLKQAVEAYEQALLLDPADKRAKWNLEIALRRLGDEAEAGGSMGRTRQADYGPSNQNTPGYEGNPEAAVGAMAGGGYGAAEGESAEELSDQQARQLLETSEREELKSHQGKPLGRTGGGDAW